MSEPILTVSGLSKKYSHSLARSLGYAVRDIARELVPSRRQHLRRDEFWALEDVSFDLRPGEALAVVGANGAGKSTLLKLVMGLLKPDRGMVRSRGTTEAIIELGTGFYPMLSGRENIRIGGALHGLKGAALRRLEDEVIDFAGIETAVGTPVQSYSTGMKARLAFALAAHLRPDLLLVDEALTVGDFAFQRKCIDHMRRYLAGGGALLFVSHNAFQIQAVCGRGLMLDRGRLAFQGTAIEALDRLFTEGAAGAVNASSADEPGAAVAIKAVTAETPSGGPPATGEPLRIALHYTSSAAMKACWSFQIWTCDEWVCVTGAVDEAPLVLDEGSGMLSCLLPRLPLLPGRYQLRAAILDPVSRFPLALYGWRDLGLLLAVGGAPDAARNAQAQIRQLMTVDVEWEAPGRAP